MSVARYFHTLRYLRAEQIYGRLWHRLSFSAPNTRPCPSVRKPSSGCEFPHVRPASMEGPPSFRFLNVLGELGSPSDWSRPARDKLWTYNLHYFDDLNAKSSATRSRWHRSLLQRWIAENPPGKGVGWDSYPMSLRIVNWIKWALSGNRLETGWTQSLAVQARWLRRRLEWHLLGNHLLANAKALIFVGLFFDGKEAEDWMRKGFEILNRELSEQILPDGGHFERSPMYHGLVLEDLFDLINLARAFNEVIPADCRDAVDKWVIYANKMRSWLKVMTHPDGEIALFNDSAFKISASPEALEGYASHLHLERVNEPIADCTYLRDSGYVRLQRGPAVAFLDVAPLGPDYLPAHGHADTLSIELSLWGKRVVVNSGTSTYENTVERHQQRGTAAHNTVRLDGKDSSEVWGAFRVARRANPLDVRVERFENGVRVSACHDGYRRLSGKPVHCREWALNPEYLEVTDCISGNGKHLVELFYHFHPGVFVEHNDPGKARLSLEPGEIAEMEVRINGAARLLDSSYHPEFGLSVPSKMLVASVVQQLPMRTFTKFAWTARGSARGSRLESSGT